MPSIPNRYKQLLASVPKGNFYAADGQVLPHRNTPYELRLTTGVNNREYSIYLNNKFKGVVSTDSSGIALITILLDKGRNDLKLVDSITQSETFSYITTRDYATLMASEAEILEQLDTNIEQVLADSRLESASASLIEDVFGRTVQTGNSFGYDLNTYRGILQELRTAYRYVGGTVDGISRVVRAFTQISPLIYPRSFGPGWILGKDFTYPQTGPGGRTYYSTSSLININAGDAGVSIVGFTSTVGRGTGVLRVYGGVSPKKLAWTPPGGGEGEQIDVTANGQYMLHGQNYFDDIIGYEGPYQIVLNQNDKLALEIDYKGIIIIALTAGASRTASQIAIDINNALASDGRYGASYNAVAAAYDSFGSGTPRVRLTTPNPTTGSIVIYINSINDASQTLFNMPGVRSGLNGSVSVGTSILPLASSTDMSHWPTPDTLDPINMLIGLSGFHQAGISNGAVAPLGQELVRVVGIDKTLKTLTLENPTTINHASNELIILEGESKYQRTTTTNSRAITVNVIDYTLLPGSTQSDSVVVAGTGLPDGWIINTNAGGSPTLLGYQKHTYFDLDRDIPFDIPPNHRVSFPIPNDILKYKGFPILISIWGRIDDPSRAATQTTINQIGISFDNQGSYDMASPTIAGIGINAQYRPYQFSRSGIVISSGTTKVWVRITTTAGVGNFTIHKVRITVPVAHAGLHLGDGTIPRNETKIKQGEFLYVWGYDLLNNQEKQALGIDSVTQVGQGHIDKIAPDLLWLDKFDISEYNIDGTSKNVLGAFSELQFLVGTIYNLDLVLQTPSRFSFLQPTTISEIIQKLSWTTSAPFVATLTILSDQDQSKAILFEDGVPVTRDQWQFTAADQVHLLYTPSSVTYELRYVSLIQFETAVIDCGASYADYLWFGDYHINLRPHIEPTLVTVNTGIQFDGNGTARLPERSNLDQSTATLIEDTGLVRRIIPVSNWQFLDAQQVSIDTDIFEPAALYEIAYEAEVNHPTTLAIAKVELKSATSSGGLSGATYQTITHNFPIGNGFRYHRMRVALSNITDIRDARIQSLLVKGINLFGAGGTVPILRP